MIQNDIIRDAHSQIMSIHAMHVYQWCNKCRKIIKYKLGNSYGDLDENFCFLLFFNNFLKYGYNSYSTRTSRSVLFMINFFFSKFSFLSRRLKYLKVSLRLILISNYSFSSYTICQVINFSK